MGEGLMDFDAFFPGPQRDYTQYSPLALAYMGDTVYEFVNRKLALQKANRSSEKLHKECSKRANARTQSQLAVLLFPEWTEEEQKVYLRGRNAEVNTKARNATILEYHEATGLEALIGYLYLTGRQDRVLYLLNKGWTELKLL